MQQHRSLDQAFGKESEKERRGKNWKCEKRKGKIARKKERREETMKYKVYYDYVNHCGLIISDDGMVTIVDRGQNSWSPELLEEFDNEVQALLYLDKEIARRKARKARRA